MSEQAPDPNQGWLEQEIYFGLHEWATYRRQGDKIQYKDEEIWTDVAPGFIEEYERQINWAREHGRLTESEQSST